LVRGAHGVEFSPNSGVLYANFFVMSTNHLYQYNVNAGSASAIIASKTKLADSYFFGFFGGMQRGPDNKIYVACYNQPSVAIIHNPDVIGTGCNYQFEGVTLSQLSSHNFPAYMESRSIDYPKPPFTFYAACPERVSFDYDKPGNVMSLKWDFDDPSSGSANTSTDLHPVHEFTANGIYRVKLIRYLACNTDTLEEEVSVTKLSVDLGNDTSLCANTGYMLQPTAAGTLDYLWQDGSTAQTPDSRRVRIILAANY
jgi:PKD repeat protein